MSPKENNENENSHNNEKSSNPKHNIESSIGLKYPTNRDHPLHTGYQWLEGKKIDDGAEGLWRIHDGLYDLRDFIHQHPGGIMWLELTKQLLHNYYVRQASTKRSYPFTFQEDGFYETLKRRIVKELQNVSKRPAVISEIMTDLLLVSYFSFSLLAVYFGSLVFGAIAGVCLSMTAIAAHNFFHQRDNFRMYYFDFTMMQSREWRISHAMSHHIYTNTVNDLEISALEPFMYYLPHPKHFIFRYLSWFYSPVVFAFLFIGHHIKTILQMVIAGEKFRFEVFLPYTLPLLILAITRQDLFYSIFIYAWIIVISGIHFGLIGVNAAHHHPDIFHDGDATRDKDDMDWGIFQLDAVMDKKDISGSHFLVLTNFGDHALHHLFPTIDHGLLDSLYPVFLDTCKQFGVEHRMTTNLELVKGQYRQLAKVKPKKEAPKHSKKCF